MPSEPSTSDATDVTDAPDAPDAPSFASEPARVTFFEDRAEVVRRARVRVAPGARWVALEGASVFIDDRSVQARVCEGDADLLAARVRRRVHDAQALGREALRALDEARREAARAVTRLELERDRADDARARLAELRDAWLGGLARVPRGLRDEAEAWRDAFEALRQALDDNTRQRAALDRALIDARRRLDLAEARHAQGQQLDPRAEARLELQLAARRAGEALVEVTYRVPMAAWRPEHLARLHVAGDDAQAEVELVTWATAWQRTGERWDDVDVAFSTARPAQVAAPPVLRDDLLTARPRTSDERRAVHVHAHDHMVRSTGLADHGQAPGVDDGGEPVSLRPQARVSVRSDGQPLRVEVARRRCPATVTRALTPEIAPVAHLRAEVALCAPDEGPDHPLLAGPVHVARGQGLVGRARVDFVAPAARFTLGFGSDDALRVRRAVEVHREQARVTGTQRVERTVLLHLSNLSDRLRPVDVTERVPVSELDEVRVDLLDGPDAWRVDEDGFAHKRVALGPHETRRLRLRYRVEAGARVRLPF